MQQTAQDFSSLDRVDQTKSQKQVQSQKKQFESPLLVKNY